MLKLVNLLTLFLISCAQFIPTEDPYPTPILHNYNQLEVDVKTSTGIVKNFGIANILIRDKGDLLNTRLTFNMMGQGNLYFSSRSCGVNFVRKFNVGVNEMALRKLVAEPRNCLIRVLASYGSTGSQANTHIIERGYLKIRYIPDGAGILGIRYAISNKSGVQLKKLMGLASFQIEGGFLSSYNNIYFDVGDRSSGVYRVDGCGNFIEGNYSRGTFALKLRDILKKDIIKVSDSCNLEIVSISLSSGKSSYGSISIYVYKKGLTFLERPNFIFKKDSLKVNTGSTFIFMCNINNKYVYSTECEGPYSKNDQNIIRIMSTNGRKRVLVFKGTSLVYTD